MKPANRSTGQLTPALTGWLPLFSQANLVHLVIAFWLIAKQWLALAMIDVTPGPMNLLASAAVVLVLTCWVRRAPPRWQVHGWVALTGAITLLLYGDMVYYRQFGDLVSIASLRSVSQVGTVKSAVTTLMRPADLLLWVDLPVMASLLALPGRVKQRWFAPLRRRFTRLAVALGLIAVWLMAAADPVLGQRPYGHTVVGSRIGLVNYHLYDVGSYATSLTARLGRDEEALAAVREWFQEQEQLPRRPSHLTGAARGLNLIILQVESLQSFAVGMVVNGQAVTPHLNGLARESLHFPQFYHQTGQGVTADADLLVNCSLHPTRTGAVYYNYADNQFRCLPALLRDHGYQTVAMQAMPAEFWNLATIYPRIGFNRFDAASAFTGSDLIGLGLSDRSFLTQAATKLQGLNEPYYAFLVTLTSHGPFDFPELPKPLDLGELEGTRAGHYLHAVHYTDQAIGQFLADLKAAGILDRSLLVVYGDHQGVWRNDTGMEQLLELGRTNEVGWARVEKRVPLWIRVPGITGLDPQPAGQLDLAPTLAGLLGIPTDTARFLGRDLTTTSGGIVPFYRGSAVNASHLYLSPDDSHLGACYELATGLQTDLLPCLSLQQQAARQLGISKLILEKDLIPALLRSDH